MKKLFVYVLALVCMSSTAVFAQDFTTAQIMAKLDEKAKAFTSLEATLSSTQVTADVKAPTQSGKLYIKMAKSVPRLLWDVTEPKGDRSTYIIDGGRFIAYNRVTGSVVRKPVEVSNDLLQLLVIGFGVPSATLSKNYTAEAKGRQTIKGVQTVVLELKSATSATARASRITLFLDPNMWTPVRNRVTEKSGDYYDYEYSDIKLNKGVAESVFNVKLPKVK
jgi:outer membrane lipoprotein-sorting protein